jgi:hypothetical protein
MAPAKLVSREISAWRRASPADMPLDAEMPISGARLAGRPDVDRVDAAA